MTTQKIAICGDILLSAMEASHSLKIIEDVIHILEVNTCISVTAQQKIKKELQEEKKECMDSLNILTDNFIMCVLKETDKR